MEMRACLEGWPDAIIPEEGQWCEQPFAEQTVVTLVTGVGPVNAALSLGRLLGTFRPRGVCNLGVAGSFDLQALRLETVCCVTAEIWPEFGLRKTEGIDPCGLGLAHGKIGGQVYRDRVPLDPEGGARAMGVCLPACCRVKSLSVAGVSGTLEQAACYRHRYDADIENMEGFALAWACLTQEVPFLELRTISNRVGSRAAGDWNLKAALARLGPVTQALWPGRGDRRTDQ